MFTPASNLSGPAWKAGKGLLPSGGYGESMGKVFLMGERARITVAERLQPVCVMLFFFFQKKIQ